MYSKASGILIMALAKSTTAELNMRLEETERRRSFERYKTRRRKMFPHTAPSSSTTKRIIPVMLAVENVSNECWIC
jgi:hypothetical protein